MFNWNRATRTQKRALLLAASNCAIQVEYVLDQSGPNGYQMVYERMCQGMREGLLRSEHDEDERYFIGQERAEAEIEAWLDRLEEYEYENRELPTCWADVDEMIEEVDAQVRERELMVERMRKEVRNETAS